MNDQERWTIQGLPTGDPLALKTWQQAEQFIETLGFLPLFKNEIPGFSLEEHTQSDHWFNGGPEDPWGWREKLCSHGRLAYGKFFAGKAGFVSKEWFPAFANYRRDGYDFDARWDDELASIRSKKIMDLFLEKGETELFSNQIRDMAGFGKEGKKGFETEMTRLQMQGYLLIKDFVQKVSKEGKPYGLSTSLYTTPERLWGEEFITSGYAREPEKCLEEILRHLSEAFVGADPLLLKRLLLAPGEAQSSSAKKTLPYPANLIKAMRVSGLSYETMTPDQLLGLTVALGQLQLKHQTLLWRKYHENLPKAELSRLAHKTEGTIGIHHAKAMSRLRMSDLSTWYLEGYNQNLEAFLKVRGLPFRPFDPSRGLTRKDSCLALGLHLNIFDALLKRGIQSISDLDLLIKASPESWFDPVSGVGFVNARDIKEKLNRALEEIALLKRERKEQRKGC